MINQNLLNYVTVCDIQIISDSINLRRVICSFYSYFQNRMFEIKLIV